MFLVHCPPESNVVPIMTNCRENVAFYGKHKATTWQITPMMHTEHCEIDAQKVQKVEYQPEMFANYILGQLNRENKKHNSNENVKYVTQVTMAFTADSSPTQD